MEYKQTQQKGVCARVVHAAHCAQFRANFIDVRHKERQRGKSARAFIAFATKRERHWDIASEMMVLGKYCHTKRRGRHYMRSAHNIWRQ